MRTETVSQILKATVYLSRLYRAVDPNVIVTFMGNVGLDAARINRYNKEQANLVGGDDSAIVERRNKVKAELTKRLETFLWEVKRAHLRTTVADFDVRLEFGNDPRFVPIKIHIPRLTEPIHIYATE